MARLPVKHIAAEPTYVGGAGRAWNCKPLLVRRDVDPPLELTVACWIVFAPYAHPFWSYYTIGCVTLRKVEGLADAVIKNPDATHEIFVYALDPNHEPNLAEPMSHHLTPINYVGQFSSPSDEAAARLIELTARDVADGTLNPDTDFRALWKHRFGNHYYAGA